MPSLFAVIEDGTDNVVISKVFTSQEKAENALDKHARKGARQQLLQEGVDREAIYHAERYCDAERDITEVQKILEQSPNDSYAQDQLEDYTSNMEYAKFHMARLADKSIDPRLFYSVLEVYWGMFRVKEVNIVVK